MITVVSNDLRCYGVLFEVYSFWRVDVMVISVYSFSYKPTDYYEVRERHHSGSQLLGKCSILHISSAKNILVIDPGSYVLL